MNQCTFSIEDLDVGVTTLVVGCCDGHQAGTIVDFILGLLVIEFDFNAGSIGITRGIHLHCTLIPLDIDSSVGIFPCELLSIVEFEVPLVGIDVDFKGVLGVWVPYGCVGTKGENGEPNNKDGWEDVERSLKFRIVPVDREGTNLDVIESGRVWLNTISVAEDGRKEPTKCENSYKN